MSQTSEQKKSSEDLVSSLRQVLGQRQWVESREGVPSMAVGVVFKGQVVLEQATKGDSPASTVFAVASISKLMVAVLALQCVEKSELKSLDIDINTCLPATCQLRAPAFTRNESITTTTTTTTTATTTATTTTTTAAALRVITPRALLTHSSGLLDDESALLRYRVFGKDYPTSLSEHVAERLQDDSIWGNSDYYHYSNLGMTILATALEHVTGQSLPSLAKTRIFAPLNMTCSSFLLSEALSFSGARVAVPHSGRKELGHSSVAEWPAAALRSTAHDLCLFLAHFSGPSPPSIISPASFAQMLPTNYCNGLAWWGQDAAYGVPVPGVWSHGGFMVGTRSHIYLWPTEETGLIFMQNGEGPYHHIVNQIVSCVSKHLGLAKPLASYQG